ncbi:MAG: hypothetical protein HS113_22745 [Verrucomicrobiales bacterium]|nr:hypothetical protein [Verrucomicrobiales bacterium]
MIVQGKAGAAVEFGNTLFLAERQDLVVDWHLYQESAAKRTAGSCQRAWNGCSPGCRRACSKRWAGTAA